MIKMFLFLFLSLLVSCGASKKHKTEIAEETPVVQERPMREEDMIEIEGVVRLEKEGCPVLIEMVEGDLFSLVYPVNLSNDFKQDGLKITFQYTSSRAPSVEGCRADRVVAVSNVKVK